MTNSNIKYPKPHILLMDTQPSVATHLREMGFNIAEGSFGKPYKVTQKEDWQHRTHLVLSNGHIPKHHAEKDIVVIDLLAGGTLDIPEGDPIVMQGGNYLSELPPFGIIDPRPLLMARLSEDFDRIYNHNGIFVVFADSRNTILGELVDSSRKTMHDYRHNSPDTWSFLSLFRASLMYVKAEDGKEIELEGTTGIFWQLLNAYMLESEYRCTLSFGETPDSFWVPIAKNKFGGCVAGVILPKSDSTTKGIIFVFPQIKNQSEFLLELFTEYLPEVQPSLFPHVQKINWTRRPEYEIPEIVTIQDEIEQIQLNAANKIAELNQQIEVERESKHYMYDLITETGDKLVNAVKLAFQTLGFVDVINMDNELQNSESTEPKREDLQIRDRSNLLVIEVKGLTYIPRDSSAYQMSKHLSLRIKSTKQFNIRGLLIVNHQRYIPGLDRTGKAFNDEILENALQMDFGLITTWNLYKLVRNFMKFNWNHEQIVDLFYRDGIIEPIPVDYEYIGYIEHYWGNVSAVGIKIETGNLCIGDTILYAFPIDYEIQKVESLQVEREAVKVATEGELAGVLTTLDEDKLKKKTRIYRKLT